MNAREDRKVLYRAAGEPGPDGYAGPVDERTGLYFGSLARALGYVTDDRHLYEVHLTDEETWEVNGSPDDHVLLTPEIAGRREHSPLCPHGSHTTNHLPTFTPFPTDGNEPVKWSCACGRASGVGEPGPPFEDAQFAAAHAHDMHVAEVAPTLRCARCGERTHTIEYCGRLP